MTVTIQKTRKLMVVFSLILLFLLINSCKDPQIKPTVSEAIEKKQKLYYMEESGGRFVLEKGYRKKTDKEPFNTGLFSLTNSERKLFVTSDLKLLKWAIRVHSFIRAVDAYNGYVDPLHYVILNVEVDGEEVECLTLEPLQITGININSFPHQTVRKTKLRN